MTVELQQLNGNYRLISAKRNEFLIAVNTGGTGLRVIKPCY
jgi:hypothetical protein